MQAALAMVIAISILAILVIGIKATCDDVSYPFAACAAAGAAFLGVIPVTVIVGPSVGVALALLALVLVLISVVLLWLEFKSDPMPTVQAAGSPSRYVASNASEPKSSSKIFLATLSVVAVVSGGVLYANRQALAARWFPSALTTMSLSGKQLRGYWNETSSDTNVASYTIGWMLAEMGALCGDAKTVNRQAALNQFAELTFAKNIYPPSMPNLYKNVQIRADEMIARLKGEKDRFCRDDYYFAIYDGRTAAANYAGRAADAGKRKLKEIEVVKKLLVSIRQKMISGARGFTDDETLVDECFKATPDETVECFWRIKRLRGGHIKSDAEQAAELINKSFPVGE
jgi:hypothetical protein